MTQKKQIAALRLLTERIDCCIKGCMIYWGRIVNPIVAGYVRQQGGLRMMKEIDVSQGNNFFTFP